jgi:hypothetical protein
MFRFRDVLCALFGHLPREPHRGIADYNIHSECMRCGERLLKWRGSAKWKVTKSRRKSAAGRRDSRAGSRN